MHSSQTHFCAYGSVPTTAIYCPGDVKLVIFNTSLMSFFIIIISNNLPNYVEVRIKTLINIVQNSTS